MKIVQVGNKFGSALNSKWKDRSGRFQSGVQKFGNVVGNRRIHWSNNAEGVILFVHFDKAIRGGDWGSLRGRDHCKNLTGSPIRGQTIFQLCFLSVT